jgi:hypothetical protein
LEEGKETTKDTKGTKVSPRSCKRGDATVRYESMLGVTTNPGTTNAEYAEGRGVGMKCCVAIGR